MQTDLPKLTKFLYIALDLINEFREVESPRKFLPPHVCTRLRLDDSQVNLMKKSGTPVYIDRTGWALTFLKKAKLISFPKGGSASITQDGKAMLEQCRPNEEIKIKELLHIKEFYEFYMPKSKKLDDAVLRHDLNHETLSSEKSTVNQCSVDVELSINNTEFPNLLKLLLSNGFGIANKGDVLEIIK